METITWSEFDNGWKAIVEQILASEEKKEIQKTRNVKLIDLGPSRRVYHLSKAVFIVGRGVLTSPLPLRSSLYYLSLLFKFCPGPPSLLVPTPTSIGHPVVLFIFLDGWFCHLWYAILLNKTMDVHMSTLRTLTHVSCKKA